MVSACILDDNEEISELISCFMNSIGAKSYIAKTIDHCLDILQRENVYLLFLDYNLYNKNCGLEICAKLHKEYPGLSIIMMSGDDDKTLIEKAFKNGAIEFIRKPLYLGELTARVHRVLNFHTKSFIVDVTNQKDVLHANLSATELKIFDCLIRQENNYIEKHNIMKETGATESTIPVHISNLRKKIIGFKIKSKNNLGYGIFKE